MINQLETFRAGVDQFVGYHPQSPLTDEQQAAFPGLNYYDESQTLVVRVAVERFSPDEPLIEMQTSTGDVQSYRRWGRFTFIVDGEEAALTLYSDEDGRDFFLPFKDATNAKETYGAGRYLDNHRPGVRQLSATRFEVDFNYSYNPYCAYNPNYSCPLPPRENWLKVPIRAGEKDFEWPPASEKSNV